MSFVIKNAKLANCDTLRDIKIEKGEISRIAAKIECDVGIDACGNLVSTGFVESHLHLDKVFLLEKLRRDYIPSESSARINLAIESENSLKQDFTVDEICRRAERAILMECENGTTSLRAQIDVDPIVELKGIEAALKLKQKFRSVIDIQIVAFPQNGILAAPGTSDLLEKAIGLGADVIGGLPEVDPDPQKHVDIVFRIARKHNINIDMHIDQVCARRPLILPYLAEKTISEKYNGKVVAAHCYALAFAPPKVAKKTIQRVKEAEINIGVRPLRMRYERMRKILEEGVNMTFFSDNIQDMWEPYGRGDMLQNALLFTKLVYDSSAVERDLCESFFMATKGAAQTIGIGATLAEGSKADIVILDAKSPADAVVNQSKRLYVIKNGRILIKNGIPERPLELLKAKTRSRSYKMECA